MLTIYGFTADSAIYQKSLGINVNLYWGVALLIFGGLMLIFALRSRGNGRSGGPKA